MPNCWLPPCLPLLLACLLRMSEPGWRPTLWLSLLLAVAWLTNAPAAVMIHYSTVGLVMVFAVVAAARLRSRSPELRHPGVHTLVRPAVRPLVRTALAVLLGACLASFYLLPAIYEQKWIDFSQVLSPGVRPQDNFLFTPMADPDHNRFNLLVSAIAVAEIGVLAIAICGSRRWRTKHAKAGSADNILWILLSAWGIATVLLMLSVSSLLWQYLPELRFVQLPFRWLLCLNAALAILLAMTASERPTSTSKSISRLLPTAFLLAAVILAGHRFQPPWWETASDVREMTDAIDDGNGYEGTDEYVPAGVDPYELRKDLPRISDDTGVPVPSKILAWSANEKHFTVRTTAAQNLIVHLFNYPAWDVVVNGKPSRTAKTDVTGLIVIPITAGDSDISIHFRRTIDRFIGNTVSLMALAVFAVAWTKTEGKMRVTERPKQQV